jgi:nicotinamidase-related amidase
MSVVIPLRAYVDASAIPTLVLVDLQEEYLASPRGLALPQVDAALGQCRRALSHARAMGFPVAFVRWIGQSPFFNRASRFTRWIEGFEPTGADMVFERDHPSCYASRAFAEVMSAPGSRIVLAGFSGEGACLSTIVDAFHRGHRLKFLSDASASHRLDDLDASEAHRMIAKVAGVYSEVVETSTWLASTAKQLQWG